jgi:TonB family protein
MDATTLSNLLAWSVQTTLLTLVADIFLRLLKVNAPVIRHASWRALLVLCLILPMIQPWRATTGASVALRVDADRAPQISVIGSSQTQSAGPSLPATFIRAVRTNWAFWVGLVLAAGAAARLALLAAGLLRLRRLRAAGQPAAPPGGQGDPANDDVIGLIEAGAHIRYVEGLAQPMTFGLFRPIVLLPQSVATLSPAVQRAVLAHELWHVRRNDWAWVLVEESIRSVFWFNPAIWWLVSRVQSSREEVVDELTVELTNARRTYLEALLVFADDPAVFPAAPFARRRHLFQRMLLISREAVMSSRRIIVSSAVMLAGLCLTVWYAASTFPLEASSSVVSVDQASALSQNPPRDRRPGEAGPETTRERQLKQEIQTDPKNVRLSFQLSKLQEDRGAKDEAEATLLSLRQALPTDKAVVQNLAQFYNRTGQFDRTIAAIEDAAAMDPSDPQGHQLAAVFYWEKAFKDKSLTPAEYSKYVELGIAATDRALAAKPDYTEAMVYKNILLRMQANSETDGAKRDALIAAADALRTRAMELSKAQKTSGQTMAFVPAGDAPPPPPPPPPPPGLGRGNEQQAVRVGSGIKPPAKIRDVKPAYPEEAKAAGVQGVVVIEVTISTTGDVSTARVLRSVPLLDQAALDAVKEWGFEPVLLNGVPVPVIMTVTVNFSLQ